MFKSVLAALAALTITTSVNAETLTYSTDQEGETYIKFEGDFTRGSGERLYNLVRETGAKYVSFNSGGGISREGDVVAWVMENLGLTAIVNAGDQCMSACAISVLGADTRFIYGMVGFHPAYMPEDRGTAPDAFMAGQYEGMQNTFFMIDRGVSRQVIRAIKYMGSQDVFMVFLGQEDFDRIFTGDFSNKELMDHFWSVKEIGFFVHLTTRGVNLND